MNSAIIVAVAIVIFRFLDIWITQKGVNRYGAGIEQNLSARKDFEKRGWVSYLDTWKNILIGIIIAILYLLYAAAHPLLNDVFLGFELYVGIFIVLNNVCVLIQLRVEGLQIKTTENQFSITIEWFTKSMMLFIIGIHVYWISGRTFLWWTSAHLMVIAMMSLYEYIKLKKLTN